MTRFVAPTQETLVGNKQHLSTVYLYPEPLHHKDANMPLLVCPQIARAPLYLYLSFSLSSIYQLTRH